MKVRGAPNRESSFTVTAIGAFFFPTPLSMFLRYCI
jgi:hypothetical protein